MQRRSQSDKDMTRKISAKIVPLDWRLDLFDGIDDGGI